MKTSKLRRGNTIIVNNITYLHKSWQLALGLMGKSRLEDECYLFDFGKMRKDMVHMLFMRFCIDIIWLDDTKKVVALYTRARPFIDFISFPTPAYYMIETSQGVIQKYNIKINDRLDFS